MSVHLTPSASLGFNRPLTQTVKRILTVTNNNELPVAFKVKTTAPKLYCVRPNSGTVQPGESSEVQVLLQAMKEEPPLNAKCKDKFLVQSTLITPEKESLSAHDFWTSLEGQESKVHQQKIKVVYLPAPGQAVEEEDEGAYNQSSMLTQGDSRYETVRSVPDQPNGHAADSIFQPMTAPPLSGERSITPQPVAPSAPVPPAVPLSPIDRNITPPADFSVAREHSHDDEPPHRPLSVPPVVQPAQQHQPLPSEVEHELREQLAQAQGEIERLRTLLASVPDPDAPALRRRNRPLSSVSDDDSTIISDGQTTEIGTLVDSAVIRPDGLAPNVVAMIALLVFITTYLFF
ncbi:VAMP-associated protein [Rickenella mellea]|uniref:VAMP-associated protein n=1 Tax=Rickenella mellea TaxID=50990 RepID=A0A4Y7Q8W4_9AGAM|nr:VAMP-associated protein [Rickenella mellea]